MPPRRSFRRPAPRRRTDAGGRNSGRIEFARRTVLQPDVSVALKPLGTEAGPWELIIRDGWEWQRSGAGQVAVRVATLSADQAEVVQGWIERIKTPAVWWAVSREIHSPGGSPEVAAALASDPWLAQVLPPLLEASTEGAPPPPPANGA